MELLLTHPQRCDESFLRDRHIPILAHPRLALFLLFQQLFLARYVAAVAFCGHVLAHRGDGFARDHFAADRGLDGDLEQMPRDQVFQALAHAAAARLRCTPVDDHAQRIDRVAVDQDAHLDKVALAVADLVVIERRITSAYALQPVVEVEHYFVERQFVDDLRAAADISQLFLHAAPVLTQFQYAAQIFVGAIDGGLDPRFLNLRDAVDVGHVGGVVQLHIARVLGLGAAEFELVDHRRRCGDEVEVELAGEAFLDDFQMEQPKETAAEAALLTKLAYYPVSVAPRRKLAS